MISGGWNKIAKKHDLEITVMGIPPLPTFTFEHENSLALHTLFSQEMLKKGFLASKVVSVSYSHSEQHVEKYLECVDDVFQLIRNAIENRDVLDLLEGPVAHEGFKRLT